MNGGENASRRKVAPPRPALITPSASPPPSSRPLSLGWSNISADRPPPTKRRRLGSTPSSPFSVSTPTSSSVGPSDDIHESRKAASQRLLNTWAGLAERYNRPLDEDDIIDLRDGSIIKDRGVLRKVAKKFEMGCFAGDDVPSDTNDASSDYGGVHTDDDVDELDAFAPGADISGELELEREKRQVPPVQARNPADAEDLREFLEAERLRREQYGEEEDEDEVIQLMSLERTPSSRSSSEWRDSSVRDEPELEDNDSRVSEDEKDDLHDVPKRPPSPPSTRTLAEDDESEDEFATWDFDTTTPVQPAKPPPRPPRPRTPDDVIDLTDSPESSPSRAPASRGRSRVPAPLASKQTEPARAKSVPRGRSRTRATPNTSVGSTKAHTPAKAPAQSKTAARRNGSMPPPPVPQRAIEQLVTPPPSSSSAIDSTPESTVAYTTKSPTPSPSPSPPPPPKTRPQPRPRYKGALLASGGTVPKSSQASPSVQNVEAVTPKAPRFKLVPEVVITSRPRSVKFPSRAPSPPPDTQEHTADAGGSHVRAEVSRKGKAKETSDPRQNIANETDRRHTQSSTKSASLPNVPITKRAVTLDANQEESDSEVPSPPPLPKVRKRKRVLSSLSLSETSDKDDPFPMVTPIVPSRPRLQDGPGPSSRRRTPKPVRKPSPRIDDDDSDDAALEPPPPPPPPRARTPHRPLPQTTGYYGAPPPLSHTPRHHDSYAPYSPAGGHDPEAQMRFAQAAHYLSYIMSAAASLPPPTGYPPLPFPSQAPPWPPWTPAHRSHRTPRDRRSDTSSPGAGPSGSASYHTPSHPHPYPFTFDPSYSSASLPPSSPPASSEPSSPMERSSSLARGRSKSRGRRVSFKLNGDERPVLPSPPRASNDDEESDGERTVASRRSQGRDTATNDRPTVARKAKSGVSGRANTPAVRADKGKTRADPVEDSEDPDSDRGRRERGRTPGPPPHRGRSAAGRAAGRKT